MKILGLEIHLPRILPFERRKSERVRTLETVYLDFTSEEDAHKGNGEVREISEGGIRFATYSKLSKGGLIHLTLRFTSEYAPNKGLQVDARILRSYRFPGQARYRVACAFQSLDEKARAFFQDFISWLKARNASQIYH